MPKVSIVTVISTSLSCSLVPAWTKVSPRAFRPFTMFAGV